MRILNVLYAIIGTVFITLSFYSTWVLKEMFDRNTEYQERVTSMSPHNFETLPTPPHALWFGDDLLGILLPTILAIIGTFCLFMAITKSSARN